MTEESSGKDEEARNLFTRLADAGEDAIQRVGDMPGVGKLAEPVMALRERVDDLQRRVRGLDRLERRLDDLERRVRSLEGGPATTEAEVLSATAAATATAGSSVPADDPTGGTAGSEESATSAQAP